MMYLWIKVETNKSVCMMRFQSFYMGFFFVTGSVKRKGILQKKDWICHQTNGEGSACIGWEV